MVLLLPAAPSKVRIYHKYICRTFFYVPCICVGRTNDTFFVRYMSHAELFAAAYPCVKSGRSRRDFIPLASTFNFQREAASSSSIIGGFIPFHAVELHS